MVLSKLCKREFRNQIGRFSKSSRIICKCSCAFGGFDMGSYGISSASKGMLWDLISFAGVLSSNRDWTRGLQLKLLE